MGKEGESVGKEGVGVGKEEGGRVGGWVGKQPCLHLFEWTKS